MGEFADLDRYLNNTANRQRFIAELSAWRRIPAISTEPDHRADMLRSAEHLAQMARDSGFTQAQLLPTGGHPAVYAERIVDHSLPTVLIYGHYDVQPVGDPAAWRTDPFEPTVKRGKIYGRGTIDDGQLLMHLKAVEAHLKTRGELPVNIKLIAEGEEEIGSEHFAALVTRERRRLAADAVIVSDTGMFARGVPTLTTSLRGMVYFELTVSGPKFELHSGEFGGGVENPLEAMAAIKVALKDPLTKQILVPGFMDPVQEPSPEMRASLAGLPFSEATFLHDAGDAPAAVGEPGYSTLERLWLRPTLEYNGEWGGYQGDGAKTIIPTASTLKFSTRLVAGQDPDTASRQVIDHINAFARSHLRGVRVSVREIHRGSPVAIDSDLPVVQAAAESMAAVFRKPVAFTGEGGSIPPVTILQDLLHAPAVLIGMGLPDDHMHGPNEKMDIAQFHRGTRILAQTYSRIAQRLGAPAPAVPPSQDVQL